MNRKYRTFVVFVMTLIFYYWLMWWIEKNEINV